MRFCSAVDRYVPGPSTCRILRLPFFHIPGRERDFSDMLPPFSLDPDKPDLRFLPFECELTRIAGGNCRDVPGQQATLDRLPDGTTGFMVVGAVRGTSHPGARETISGKASASLIRQSRCDLPEPGLSMTSVPLPRTNICRTSRLVPPFPVVFAFAGVSCTASQEEC